MCMKLKKKIIIITLLVIICCTALAYAVSQIPIQEIENTLNGIPHGLRELCMIGLITLQIFLAFLPGEPLELVAGFLFGSVGGTILCLAGSILGTLIVYVLVQKFGHRIVSLFFKQKTVDELHQVLERRNSLYWMFLIFLIPGSPKDLMTYVVSLSNIALWKWLLLTTVGRIPSIITSTFMSGSIKEGNYLMAIVILIVTIALVGAGGYMYKKMKEES